MTSTPRLNRRTFLRGTAGLAAAGALSACGGNTGREDTGGGGGEGGGDMPTIRQWYHQYGEEGTEQAVQKYAEAYKDANIDVQWTAGDYEAKKNAALQTDDGPDVFEGTPKLDLVKAGQIVPLDDIFGDALSDFAERDIKESTIDGKIYSVKMVEDIGLLYYRKSMLQEAGVNPPQTFDELIDAAKALNTKDVKGLFVGNDGGVSGVWGGAALLGLMPWSAGLDFIDEDNNILFDEPEAIDVYLQMKELWDSKTLLLGAPTDWWDPSAFNQGLCAMAWGGLWALPAIKETLQDDFGVVPWPKATDSGEFATFLGGWGSMVSAKAKDVDAAKEFVKWLWIDQKEFQKDWNLSYGFHIPPRTSIAEEADELKEDQAADALEIAQYAMPTHPAWNRKMSTTFGDAVTNIVKKGANPQSELKSARATVQKELDRVLA